MKDQTLEDYFTGTYCVEKPIAESTICTYLCSIHALNEWHGRPIRLSELTNARLSRFIQQSEGTVAARTLKGRRGDIMVIWRHAAAAGRCPHFPQHDRIRKVKIPRCNPDAWKPEELAKMIEAAKKLKGYLRNGVKRASYFEVLLRFAYETGLRRGDLLKFAMRQLGDDGTVTVTMSKTGEVHVCQISTETISMLRRISARLLDDEAPNPDRPLAWPHSHTLLYAWMGKIRKAAGVEDGALQKVRRTAATQIEKATPGAAMSFLGHLTPGLAYRHYVDRSQAFKPKMPPALVEGMAADSGK